MKALLLTLSLLSVLMSPPQSFAKFPQESIIQISIARSAVVDCYTYDPKTHREILAGAGSATHYKDGLYLTAAHVVYNEETGIAHPLIKVNGMLGSVVDSGKRDGLNFVSDWAVIYVPSSKQSETAVCHDFELGEFCFRVGNDNGFGLVPALGLIGSLMTAAGSPTGLYETTMSVRPGASGGGVFNGNGELIGILTSMNLLHFDRAYPDPSLGYFIKIGSDITEALDSASEKIK